MLFHAILLPKGIACGGPHFPKSLGPGAAGLRQGPDIFPSSFSLSTSGLRQAYVRLTSGLPRGSGAIWSRTTFEVLERFEAQSSFGGPTT